MPRLRMVGLAEAQRVHVGDRPRAHGEDVAHDAADAGRRALVGLDEARVVVAFHLEDGGLAVADVDDAGILARALDHPRRLGRQLLQMDARGFVGAVLAPHHREDAELGQRSARGPGSPAPAAYSSGVRPCSATMFGRDLGGGIAHDSASTMLVEQRLAVGRAEQRLDGVLRMRHQAQHVLGAVEDAGDVARRAVGVVASSSVAVGAAIAERDLAVRLRARSSVSLVGEVIAVVMRDRHAEHLALSRSWLVNSVWRVSTFRLHVAADELEAGVAHQDAGQQPRLGEDLEAVADAEHRPCPCRRGAFTSRMIGEWAAMAPQRR